MFLISPYSFARPLLIDQITALGLTSGLQLCLDAGDATSYTSGQTWTDRSGNGYDFFRGTTSSSQATDPTFNGTAGGASSSEYWSFDGGDYFTLGQANPTWVNNLHKNNATGTLLGWFYIPSTGVSWTLMGTYSGGGSPFFQFILETSGQLSFAINDGSGGLNFDQDTSGVIPTNQWAFLAVSVNEAGNSIVLEINGSQETFSCTYTTPSSSNAGNTVKLGADGDGLFPMISGSRLASYAAWSTNLSAANLLDLYNATKGKFGL